MKAYQADMQHFDENNTQVLGISVDSFAAQKVFAEKEGITFPLLSDLNRKVARAYGVINEEQGVANRVTFVIDKEGVIRRIDSGRDALDIAGAKSACGSLK